MGTSMMEILNSSTKHTVQNAIDHGLRIRLWWALFMADNWSSSSLGLPRQMKESARPGHLPVDKQFFASLTPEDPRSVVRSCHVPGLWAHMSTLVELFPAIQDLNRRVVDRKDSRQSQLEQDTDQIARQLDAWQDNLPAEANDTSAVAPVGSPYVIWTPHPDRTDGSGLILMNGASREEVFVNEDSAAAGGWKMVNVGQWSSYSRALRIIEVQGEKRLMLANGGNMRSDTQCNWVACGVVPIPR